VVEEAGLGRRLQVDPPQFLAQAPKLLEGRGSITGVGVGAHQGPMCDLVHRLFVDHAFPEPGAAKELKVEMPQASARVLDPNRISVLG
jgi:hypothetical protein